MLNWFNPRGLQNNYRSLEHDTMRFKSWSGFKDTNMSLECMQKKMLQKEVSLSHRVCFHSLKIVLTVLKNAITIWRCKFLDKI